LGVNLYKIRTSASLMTVIGETLLGELKVSACPIGGTFFAAAPILMSRQKKKLTPKQKAAKKKRREEYMTIFVNGKQKSVKRPETVDGIPVDEFILRNADPIWLIQNEMWEYIDQNEDQDSAFDDDENPFE